MSSNPLEIGKNRNKGSSRNFGRAYRGNFRNGTSLLLKPYNKY